MTDFVLMDGRVSIAGTTRVRFQSTINGRRYALSVARPPPSQAGTIGPAIFVLDGDPYFPLVLTAVRNRSVIGREIEPSTVIGIGYDDEDGQVWQTERSFDFTPSPRGRGDFQDAPASLRFGGLSGFLDVLEHEITPWAAQILGVDIGASALWGHSLGGLAVTSALLARPMLFQTFLAISPALWWNDRVVLADLGGLADRLDRSAAARRVFIGVGGREESPPPGVSDAIVEQELQRARMIGNARALAQDLAARGGLDVTFSCPPDETHITVPFATLRTALDIAFPLRQSGSDV